MIFLALLFRIFGPQDIEQFRILSQSNGGIVTHQDNNQKKNEKLINSEIQTL
jgi:hypothetical protein